MKSVVLWNMPVVLALLVVLFLEPSMWLGLLFSVFLAGANVLGYMEGRAYELPSNN